MTLADFKAAIQGGQHQTARWIFVQLLDDPSLSREELAEAYCEASVAEYRAGHLHTAVAWSKVAAKLAAETQQLLLLSRVTLNLIEFQRLAGDTASAINTGLRWLSDHGDNPEVKFRSGRFYFNLAVTYQQRDEVSPALEHYEKAWNQLRAVRLHHPDESERQRCRVYEVMALQNAAWLMYESNMNGMADELVGQARRLLPEGDTLLARGQNLLEALDAQNRGESDRVLAIVNETFATATTIPTLHLFWLYWLAAKALLRHGKSSTGSAYATMALQASEETKDARLIRLARGLQQEIDRFTS